MAIYLIITEGNDETRVRLTQKPFFIGRSSKCHLTLEDSMISGKHLAVKLNSDSRVVIKDLETTNGTYLNGNKIQETFLYLEDFVQFGKVKIVIDDSEMTAKELGLHKRDFERTSVTFVRLGAQVEGLDDLDEDEFGQSKQKTLLAKLRKKKENEDTVTAATQSVAKSLAEQASENNEKKVSELESLELKNEKKAAKKVTKKTVKKRKVKPEEDEKSDGLVGKLKGLFKKD